MIRESDSLKNSLNHAQHLHFFQDNSKKLHILDLKKALSLDEFSWKEINLNINFKIPIWHRSIMTQQGTIYLTGGSDLESEYKTNLKDVYVYAPFENILKPLAGLNYARNSHGICILQDFMYVIGGCSEQGGYTASCERFAVNKHYEKAVGEWQIVASLNQPANSPCVVNFNDDYIYKFGGVLNLSTMNNTVERYDPKLNVWTEINYQVFGNKYSSLSLLAASASVQINRNEILIFGGHDLNRKSNQCCICRVDGEDLTITNQSDKVMPYIGTFWTHPVLIGRKIFCAQNLQLGSSDIVCFNRKRLLCLDGDKWEEILSE